MSDPKMFEVGPDGLCEFERLAILIAERLARRWKMSDDNVHNAKQEAWYQARARKGTPGTVAHNACCQVLAGRGLGMAESVRSIDHPNPVRSVDGVRKRVRPATKRGVFHLQHFAKEGENPAEIAAFEIDFADWRNRLDERKRAIVEAFLEDGLTTREAAKFFKVSPGRISQIRRELEQEWDKMFADED